MYYIQVINIIIIEIFTFQFKYVHLSQMLLGFGWFFTEQNLIFFTENKRAKEKSIWRV